MLVIEKKLDPYRNKNGNIVFRYVVKGEKKELDEYEKVRGTNFRKDAVSNEPLFFSTIPLALGTVIVKNYEGNSFYPKTDLEEQVMKQQELEASKTALISALQKAGFSKDDILRAVLAA